MEIDTTDAGGMLEKIEETLKVTRENNKLLKAMRRDAIIGGVLKMVIWLALILVSFYLSAKFLEPYLGMMTSGQGGKAQDFGALFEQYKSLMGQ
jgi:hypothetical protein